MIFRTNERLVDTHAFEVRRNGKAVPVQPQVLDLLILLLENRDRLVTKEEIIDRIWHGRVVSDATLNSRIKSARQAIGDSGASQQLIRTIRGRGLRFVGAASESPCEAAADRKTTHAPTTQASAPTAVPGMPASSHRSSVPAMATEARPSWWTIGRWWRFAAEVTAPP
jgi:DNA-binding winged helix-turn-helix (wHTH) protein